MSNVVELPRMGNGLYPERSGNGHDGLPGYGAGFLNVSKWPIFCKTSFIRIRSIIEKHGDLFESMDDVKIDEKIIDLRYQLRRVGLRPDLVAESFALIREISGRSLGMRHYPCQLYGGFILLQGMVAEMQTGEGKTLTATLAAGTAALAGVQTHVVSVNDYLTSRDAESMAPIYQRLGLSVGTITSGMALVDRRQAYACSITYCTNKELVFDYLKDRITLGNKSGELQLAVKPLCDTGSGGQALLLRGLRYAIIDEADSVLIDEARTPLIISGQGRKARNQP